MQSDKLPKMPEPKHFQVLSPIDSDRTHVYASGVYTEQDMKAYALAARKMALEEAADIVRQARVSLEQDA